MSKYFKIIGNSSKDYNVSLDDAKADAKADGDITWFKHNKNFCDRHGNEMIPVYFNGKIFWERKHQFKV